MWPVHLFLLCEADLKKQENTVESSAELLFDTIKCNMYYIFLLYMSRGQNAVEYLSFRTVLEVDFLILYD